MHCAAIYDITVGEPEQRAANVDGTRAVAELAARLDATLHHVSSIAVAGDFHGEYTEADFDIGQELPTPYHQTKFEAELLVRSTPGLRYRIYRPAVVVGDSRTGEMDKIDGPYYFFGVLAKLAVLPRLTPIMLPDTGRTNIVPVDYVVDALVALMHADGRDGQTFHLTSPKTIGLRGIYRGIAGCGRSAAAARFAAAVDGDAVAQSAGPTQGVAQHGRHPTGHPRRGSRRRRPRADVHLRTDAERVARHRDCGTGVQQLRTGVVAVLGRAPRPRPGPPRRPGGTAGRSARDHHRRVQRHRPGVGDRGRRTGRDASSRWPATPTRSTIWSPRFARTAVRPTPSPAMSPTQDRSNTPSRTSWAGSTTSTTW